MKYFLLIGLNINVSINATTLTVNQSMNFTFFCSTPIFSSFIAKVNGEEDDRIVEGALIVNETICNQTFILTNVTYKDAKVSCVANNTWESNLLPLNVLCELTFNNYSHVLIIF